MNQMKHSRLTFKRSILLRFSQGAVELFYSFPIVLLSVLFLLEGATILHIYGFLALLMLAGAMWYFVMGRFSLTKTPLVILLFSMLAAIGGLALLFNLTAQQSFQLDWKIVAVWLFFTLVCYRGSSLARKGWEEFMPIGFFWFSVLLTGLLYYTEFLLASMRQSNMYPLYFSSLHLYEGVMITLFIIGVLMNLLLNNAHQLMSVSKIDKSVMSLKDLFNNQLMVLVIVMFIIALYFTIVFYSIIGWLALIIAIVAGFTFLMRKYTRIMLIILLSGSVILGLFVLIDEFIEELYEEEEPDGGTEETEALPGNESVMPESSSLFWERVDWVVMVVLALLFIIFLYLLFHDVRRIVKWMYERIKAFIAGIWEWLNAKQTDSKKGYEDEEVKLNAMEDMKATAQKMRQWVQDKVNVGPRWKDMKTNRERVRYLYRRLIKRSSEKGFPYQSSNTPNETMRQLHRWENVDPSSEGYKQMGELYSRVRYSDEDVEEDELSHLKSKYDK